MKGSPSGEGSAIHTSAPPSGPFSAWALPPCAAATAATMASPRPEPDPPIGGAAREAIEGAGQEAGREAGALVADVHLDPVAVGTGADAHGARRRGAGRSRRGCRAPGAGDRGRRRRPAAARSRRRASGRASAAAGANEAATVSMTACTASRLGPDRQRVLVEAREGQQLLGERDEAVGLLGGRVHHAPQLLAIGVAGRGELELALEDGQRRAQLVAGVGDEGALARACTRQPARASRSGWFPAGGSRRRPPGGAGGHRGRRRRWSPPGCASPRRGAARRRPARSRRAPRAPARAGRR